MSLIEEALQRVERMVGFSIRTAASSARAHAAAVPRAGETHPAQERLLLGMYLLAGIIVSMLLIRWWIPSPTAAINDETIAPPLPATAAVPSSVIPPTGRDVVPSLTQLAPQTPHPAGAGLTEFASPTQHAFRLSGIVTKPGAPLAVINDRILRVGDVIEEAIVRDITPTTVVLEQHNTQLTLYLSR